MFWHTLCCKVGRLKSEERSRYACFSILRKALVFMVTEPCVFVLSACVVIDIGMVDQCIMYAFFRKIQVVIMGLLKLDDDDHCTFFWNSAPVLPQCTFFQSTYELCTEVTSFILTGTTIHVESIVIKLYSLAHL